MKTKKVGLAARPVQVDKNDQNKDFADDKFDRKEVSSYNTGNIHQNFMEGFDDNDDNGYDDDEDDDNDKFDKKEVSSYNAADIRPLFTLNRLPLLQTITSIVMSMALLMVSKDQNYRVIFFTSPPPKKKKKKVPSMELVPHNRKKLTNLQQKVKVWQTLTWTFTF